MPAAPIEESLLDLFRSEAETQALALSDALAALTLGEGSPKQISAALEAVQSIKGAARLVGLELAAQMAEAMEKLLAEALEQKQLLAGPVVQAVENAYIWLAQFSQFPSADMVKPTTDTLEGHAACLSGLKKFLTGPRTQEKKSPAKVKNANVADQPAGETSPPMPELRYEPAPAPPPASKIDFSLLDLYRGEAETQLAGLGQGIVELEGDLTNPKKIEPVMRAAHSLKGAARIIGLDLVVQLSHTMEDALVAAQQGRLALDAGCIDALLSAGDWIGQFSKLPQEQLAAPPPEQIAGQAQCLADIQAALSGHPAKKERTTAGAESEANVKSQSPSATQSESKTENRKSETTSPISPTDGVVRISAASLSRMMGLAAESLVEARRLEPFRDQLLKLKNNQLQFVSRLEAAAQTPVGPANAAGADIAPLCAEAQNTLAALREQLESFDNAARRSTLLSGRLYQEVIASRMRPFGEGTQAFPRLVRDVCRTLGKQAKLEIEGRETPVDRDILEKLEAPLSHLLRNACDHGLETPEGRIAAGKPEVAVIRLEARHRGGMLVVQVGEDGRGISVPKLRQKIVEKGRTTAELAANMSEDEVLQFLFLPGFSTAEKITEISGRGVGLDVVQELVRDVGGAVRIYTSEGRGTVFSLQLPVTRSVLRALLVEIAGEAYAFPLTRLYRAVRTSRDQIVPASPCPQISVDGLDASVVSARLALGLPSAPKNSTEELAAVVVTGGMEFYALAVDRFLGETDLVVRPLDPRLGKVPGIQSAALSEDGAPILIVDVDDLLPRLEKIISGEDVSARTTATPFTRQRVLVVDDSATVRETARKILEGAGLEVETAVDGADGWNAVRVGRFDLVVSDVDMPRLDGLGFVAKIRADARLQKLPVVMVSYKDREEDRARGRTAGADEYLAKSSLTDDSFLSAVRLWLEVSR